MAIKVCLDAGHYGKQNQSPANKAYWESEMVWKLTLYQKQFLEALGIQVITTRDIQSKDRALYDRGAASKGCDLFISNHSNAVGDGVNEGTDYPVSFVLLSGKSTDIGLRLAQVVERVIGTKQPGRIATRRGDNGEYYGVLRGAAAVGTPAVLLEHSFHTNTRVTNWLLKEPNLQSLARAEAEEIASYFGIVAGGETVNKPQEEVSGDYRVKVSIANLNIRTGPGTNYKPTGKFTGVGVFTIVETRAGSGSAAGWGKLKSGSGWISLDYANKI